MKLLYFSGVILTFIFNQVATPVASHNPVDYVNSLVCLSTGCFYFGESVYNWWVAKDLCKQHQMDLVVIDSKEKQSDIETYVANNKLKTTTFWIGATDLGHEGRFTWEFIGENLVYNNWAEGEPNNLGGDENCVMFELNKLQWNDLRCDYNLGYICQPHEITFYDKK